MREQFRVTLKRPLTDDKRSPGLLTADQLADFVGNIILRPGLHPVRKISILNDTLQEIVIERVDS